MYDAHAVQKGQGTGDFVHQTRRIGFGIGAVLNQVFKHFPARNQIQNQVIVIRVFVHIAQARDIGMTAIVKNTLQGIGFRLKGRRVGIMSRYLFNGDFLSRRAESTRMYRAVGAFPQHGAPVDAVLGQERASPQRAATVQHYVAGRCRLRL